MFKIMKVTLLLLMMLVFISCNANEKNTLDEKYSLEGQKGLQLSKRILASGDEVTITLPETYPKYFAIETPKGEWFYVIGKLDKSSKVLLPESIKSRSFSVKIDDLKGVVWKDGEQEYKNVFSGEGEYLFYIADNLETEPENTYFFKNTVYYLSVSVNTKH